MRRPPSRSSSTARARGEANSAREQSSARESSARESQAASRESSLQRLQSALIQPPVVPPLRVSPAPTNLVEFGSDVKVGDERDGSVPLVTPRGTEWVQPQGKLKPLEDEISSVPTLGEVAAVTNSVEPVKRDAKRDDSLPPAPPLAGPGPATAGQAEGLQVNVDIASVRDSVMSPLSPSVA